VRRKLLVLVVLLAAAPAHSQVSDDEPRPDAELEYPDEVTDTSPTELAPQSADAVGPVETVGPVDTMGPVDTVGQVQPIPPPAAPTLPAPPSGPGLTPRTPPSASAAPPDAGEDTAALQEQVQQLQSQVGDLQAQQQQIADLQQQVANLQGAGAQSDELVQRGNQLEAARIARTGLLTDVEQQLDTVLGALSEGTYDYGGGLDTLEASLTEAAENARAAGAVEEAQLVSDARDMVEAARIDVGQKELYGARWSIGLALPRIRRARTLAATSDQHALFGP
jgi:hypothetical protein